MVIKSVEWLRGVHITWMLVLDSKKPRPQCNFLKKSLWLFIAKSLRLQALKKRIINYFHLRVLCSNTQPFHAKCWKMTKHTLKILRCSHRKIFKVSMAIFQHYMLDWAKISEFFVLSRFFHAAIEKLTMFSQKYLNFFGELNDKFTLFYKQLGSSFSP